MWGEAFRAFSPFSSFLPPVCIWRVGMRKCVGCLGGNLAFIIPTASLFPIFFSTLRRRPFPSRIWINCCYFFPSPPSRCVWVIIGRRSTTKTQHATPSIPNRRPPKKNIINLLCFFLPEKNAGSWVLSSPKSQIDRCFFFFFAEHFWGSDVFFRIFFGGVRERTAGVAEFTLFLPLSSPAQKYQKLQKWNIISFFVPAERQDFALPKTVTLSHNLRGEGGGRGVWILGTMTKEKRQKKFLWAPQPPPQKNPECFPRYPRNVNLYLRILIAGRRREVYISFFRSLCGRACTWVILSCWEKREKLNVMGPFIFFPLSAVVVSLPTSLDVWVSLPCFATTEEIERIHHNAFLFFFREPKSERVWFPFSAGGGGDNKGFLDEGEDEEDASQIAQLAQKRPPTPLVGLPYTTTTPTLFFSFLRGGVMDLSMRGRSGCESESLPFPNSIYRRAPTKHRRRRWEWGEGGRGENEKRHKVPKCANHKKKEEEEVKRGRAHSLWVPEKNQKKQIILQQLQLWI